VFCIMRMDHCLTHNAPALLAFSSVIVNLILFIYQKLYSPPFLKILPISTVWLVNLLIYSFLILGLAVLVYDDLDCRQSSSALALLVFNWVINISCLHYSIISVSGFVIYAQAIVSLFEVISLTWATVRILLSFSLPNIPYIYWPISVGCCLWAYLCNLLWLNSLYSLRLPQTPPYESLLTSDNNDDFSSNLSSVSFAEQGIVNSIFFLWFTPTLSLGCQGRLSLYDLIELPPSLQTLATRKEMQISQSHIYHNQSGEDDRPQRSMWESVFSCLFRLISCGCCSSTNSSPQSNDIAKDSSRIKSIDSEYSLADIEEVPASPSPSPLPPLFSIRPLLLAILVEGNRGRAFLHLGGLKLLSLLVSFVGPLLLGRMVALIEASPKQSDIPMGLLLACCLGLSFVVLSMLNTQYGIRAAVLHAKIRSAFSLGE
jgi:hypothetical protein